MKVNDKQFACKEKRQAANEQAAKLLKDSPWADWAHRTCRSGAGTRRPQEEEESRGRLTAKARNNPGSKAKI